ncbi:MAG: DUF547 domain-containing protein [Bacteroidota bacterium]
MKNFLSFFTLLVFVSTSSFSQKINQPFFNEADAFFSKNVQNGLVKYADLKNDAQLVSLIKAVQEADLSSADANTKKAFYINAYNLHVINAAAQLYPLNSVQSVGGFFDRKKIRVAGENLTLNNLEKEKLLKPYQDARLHFVLVCGAIGCPPITDFAYRPAQLESQMEQQTKLALNNPDFIKVTSKGVGLSQIFSWYASDFGGNKKSIINFINKFRNSPISQNADVSYYNYDWTLNDQSSGNTSISNQPVGNNATRYIVSSTIPKGSVELKLFNNLYTQRTGSEGNLTDRATFLTSSLSFLYGLNNKLNVGFATRYRRVRNDVLPSSALSVFSSGEESSSRQGLTAFGPQIRWAPVEKWTNFSIQSSFVFPIGDELSGSATQPFIDWNGATWWTQVFNDFTIGNNFSLFTEIDFLIEDIGSSADGHLNRFSTPAVLIFSYSPSPKSTIYALGGYSPFWQDEFDYFVQGGFGTKYQFTPNIELELLYTGFTNKFLRETGGDAATYNIGFRFNL